jgi:hypothetical protein
MQHTPPIASVIVWSGESTVVDLPAILRLLVAGLTPHDYTTLALVAHQYALTIPDLMRLALESEGGR